MADDTPKFQSDDVVTGAAQGRLRAFVERLERLNEDKAVIANDTKEVYAEAKGEGFDVKILRKVVRLRGQDAAKRSEEEALIDLYMSALEQPLPLDLPVQHKPKAKGEKSVIQSVLDGRLEAAIDASNLGIIDREMQKIYLRNATDYVRAHGKFRIRDLETGLHWGKEVAVAIVGMLEHAAICTKADKSGFRQAVDA